ncbi:hypothetical protein [Actinoplanes sp. NPDC051494]|uniref:hypothetical protein n=1 Tax=Actinoplanes sp. NPDC051494 TaxID=3363907 RepID=UPI0037BD8CCE
MNVSQLRELFGWRSPARPIDWAALGRPLPTAFRELAENFPPGEFQTFFKLLHPAHFAGPREFHDEVAGYRAIVEDWAPGDLAAGLLPWGTIGFDAVLCWHTDDDDPDSWPIVIVTSDPSEWETFALSTTDFVAALVTDPPVITEWAHIAEAVQPPAFAPYGVEPPESYWTAGLDIGVLERDVDALARVVGGSPLPGFDENALFSRAGQTLPGDYCAILALLGPIRVGPARLLGPDDHFTERQSLTRRVKAERAAGGGPLGPVYPEDTGLIVWGRLDDGGYLCWAQNIDHRSRMWPVVVLSADLRHHVTHAMSTSRFLLRLAEGQDLLNVRR